MFDHSYSPDIARGLVDRAGRPCPTGQYACKCGLVGASHDRPVCSHYTPADLAGSPCNTCDNDYSVHRPEWVRRAQASRIAARAVDPCDPEPEYLTRLRARYLELRPDEAPAVIDRQEPEWVRRARAHALPPKDTGLLSR